MTGHNDDALLAVKTREKAVCFNTKILFSRKIDFSCKNVRTKLFTHIHLCIHSVDKKNQLDVTFCILYYSSNSYSIYFGQPCAHHQKLTTA